MIEQQAIKMNRLALALFRAESVGDTDALAVLQARVEELPNGERETLQKVVRNLFAAAQAAPAKFGPEEFFDRYSEAIDQAEKRLDGTS